MHVALLLLSEITPGLALQLRHGVGQKCIYISTELGSRIIISISISINTSNIISIKT